MVNTDNVKSKCEFKKLSMCMSDKLDKEKGRSVLSCPIIPPTVSHHPSIQELEAPDFKHDPLTSSANA
jgi:hypothetical protein